ncbi:hypothetical protein, partial [uncultured Rothia sp.]|uniref:hypothetical protein n=1 Tax=uncultured Rothia sp. TaxID=316088 RepID=UPI0025D12489
ADDESIGGILPCSVNDYTAGWGFRTGAPPGGFFKSEARRNAASGGVIPSDAAFLRDEYALAS